MNARVNPPAEGEATPVDQPAPVNDDNVRSPAAQDTGAPSDAAPKNKRRGRGRLLLMISVPAVLAVAGAYFYLTGGRYAETDNAYVNQSIVSLSPDISGRIVDVNVHENQTVKAGAVLFRIDPVPFRIELDKAQAALAAARVKVDQLRVAYKTAETQLKSARSTLDIRQREQSRITNLVNKGVSTAAASDNASLSYQQAVAAVDQAGQAVAAAEAALGGNPNIATEDHPAVRAAAAAVETARRDLANTTVRAPAPGIVSQVDSLNVGQFISKGATIASLVETDDSWIEANFKETQLTGMKVGQPATVSVDAYPGVVLDGKVGSIGPATGSEFALIPAQNATGNWVKVVQRIPVRIDLASADHPALRAGMSTTASVDTGKTRLDALK